jgi:tetratricopeptide (TPR) repeat protein
MEQADELYQSNRFAEALELYEKQARRYELPNTQEARCKAAICLVALSRNDEAVKRFEELAIESGDRWPVVASCQLWLLYLRTNRRDTASAILSRLSTQYRFESLAAFITRRQKREILDAYSKSTYGTFEHVRFNPNRIAELEAASTAHKLLRESEYGEMFVTVKLMEAYASAGDKAQAFKLAQQLTQDLKSSNIWRKGPIISFVLDLYLHEGRNDEALRLVESYTQVAQSQMDRDALAELSLYRAKLHILSKQFDQAERILDELSRNPPASFADDGGLNVCILRGFLRHDRGDEAGALAIWKEGYQQVKERSLLAQINGSIVASLSNELTEQDVAVMTNWIVTQAGSYFPFAEMFRNRILPLHEVTPALRNMWRTPRGMDYAKRLTLGNCSYFEFYGIQVLLSVHETLRFAAFGGKMSEEEDAVIWQMVNELMTAWLEGKLNNLQVAQDYLGLMGDNNQLGWKGVAPALPDNVHALLAFSLGHRYRQLKRPAESQEFFRAVASKSAQDTLLHRLAEQELKRQVAR